MKVLVCGGNPAMIPHFRGPVLRELVTQGHEVVAVGGWRDANAEAQLDMMGVRYLTWPVVPTGLNPFRDLAAIRRLNQICAAERPDVFFGYALKPGMYGALAAAAAGIPRRVILIEGLGYAFGNGGELKRKMARAFAELVFAAGLKAAHHLVVLNRDDEAFFRARAPKLPITRMPGIGVDLNRFKPSPLPEGPMTFVMISRLLKDKGVGVFVEAARQVKAAGVEARFLLVGPHDPSPNGFSEAEVHAWHDQGWVEYMGSQKDVRPFLAQSHVLVLPSSYREGLPATLMEAAASGRPLITTDGPGCRDGVIDGKTGLLMRSPKVDDLASAISALTTHPERVADMAVQARRFAEAQFSHHDHARRLAEVIIGPTSTP